MKIRQYIKIDYFGTNYAMTVTETESNISGIKP